LGGAVVGKGLEVGADFALDLVDEFLLSGTYQGLVAEDVFRRPGKTS